MAIEQMLQAVISASPAMRRKIESVLSGTDTPRADGGDTRLVTISGTARLLNVGRNVVYNLIRTERLDTVDLNGSKRVTMRSITAFLNGERPANEKTQAVIAEGRARYAASKARED